MSDEMTPDDASLRELPSVAVDWFLGDLGVVAVPLTEELKAAMLAHAREFLMAGGQVGWADWSRLGPASRAAFREAAEELKIRNVLSGNG